MCCATLEDAALRGAWDERIAKKRTHDAVAVNNEGVINAIECTILEADEKGVDLTFKLKTSGKDVTKPLAAFAGLLFQHTSIPKPAGRVQADGHRPVQSHGLRGRNKRRPARQNVGGRRPALQAGPAGAPRL